MEVSNNDFLLLRQCKSGKGSIQVLNRLTGEVIREVASQCDHTFCQIRGHPVDKDIILENCLECDVISQYDINAKRCETIYTGFEIIRMCRGASGSVLALDKSHQLLQFDWIKEHKMLRHVKDDRNMKLKYADGETESNLRLCKICYMEQKDILILTTKKINCDNLEPFDVRTIKLKDIEKQRIDVNWRLSGVLKPFALACDNDCNIYVSDIKTNNIYVIDSSSGKPVKILTLPEGSGGIRKMCWSRSQPHLTVHQAHQGAGNTINCYNV